MKRWLLALSILCYPFAKAEPIADTCYATYNSLIQSIHDNQRLSPTLKQDFIDLLKNYYHQETVLKDPVKLAEVNNTLQQLIIWNKSLFTQAPYHLKVAFGMAVRLVEKQANHHLPSTPSKIIPIPLVIKNSVIGILRYAKKVPYLRAIMEQYIVNAVHEQIVTKKFEQVQQAQYKKRPAKKKRTKTLAYATVLECIDQVSTELKQVISTSTLYDQDLQKKFTAALQEYVTYLKLQLQSISDEVLIDQALDGLKQLAIWHTLLEKMVRNKKDTTTLKQISRIAHELVQTLQSSTHAQLSWTKKFVSFLGTIITDEDIRQANIFTPQEIADIIIQSELDQQSMTEKLTTVNHVLTATRQVLSACLPSRN